MPSPRARLTRDLAILAIMGVQGWLLYRLLETQVLLVEVMSHLLRR